MSDIQHLTELATFCQDSYYTEPASDSAVWMQNRLLSQIALQLAKQNEVLARIAEAVDNGRTFAAIATTLERIDENSIVTQRKEEYGTPIE